MAGNDDSEGPGILVVSLKGDQRPVTREHPSGPHARPQGLGDPGFQPPPSTGIDPNEAIFGGATSAPAPAPPSGSGLELDEPAAAGPGKKKVRPELAEWGQQLTTGEHPAMPQVPAAASGAHAAASRAHASPPSSGRGKVVGAVLALVVAGLGFVVWQMTSAPGRVSLSEASAEPTARPAPSTSGFVLRPENAPDCWTSDDGYHFVYKASSGAEKAVSTIVEVPVLYRITARCVRD